MKFSVITVVYNGAEHLEQTIKSVINQKGIDIEYIIIDGGSTDGSIDIIKKYETDISYWISEKDNGVYDAMNKALRIATGDVISFINSDDWYEPNAFVKVQKCFEQTDESIIYGRTKITSDVAKSEETEFSIEPPEMIHINNIYCHQGLFIKKNVFDLLGNFNTKYKVLADYDFNLRAYNNGLTFCCIPDVVAHFRLGGISTTEWLQAGLEFHEIALFGLNGRVDFIPQIEREFNLLKERVAIKILFDDNFELMREIFNDKKGYYVWGAGGYGKDCVKLLQKKKINVLGVIDSNPKASKIGNYKNVCASSFFGKYRNNAKELLKIGIIITPRNYENEIKENLFARINIEHNNIILYSEVCQWACQRYKSEIEKILSLGEKNE